MSASITPGQQTLRTAARSAGGCGLTSGGKEAGSPSGDWPTHWAPARQRKPLIAPTPCLLRCMTC